MKTKKLNIILTLVVICLLWGIGYAQNPTVAENQQKMKEISDTTIAEGLLEIKNIPSSNTLFQKDDLLETLLMTTGKERIALEVFGEPYREYGYGPNFTIKCSLESQTVYVAPGKDLFNHLYLLRIGINPDDAATLPMALELRQAAVKFLKSVILKEHEYAYAELSFRLDSITMEKKAAEIELRDLESVQKKQTEAGYQRNLSRTLIRSEIDMLEGKKERLGMELNGNDARQGAIEEQIARIGKQAEVKLADDPILEELKKVLQIREEKLERTALLIERGSVHPTELADIQEQVALAKIDIARRREEIGKTAGGELLRNWNIELAELSIKRAEIEAQLSYTQMQLDEIEQKDLFTLADRIEHMNSEISRLKTKADAARRQEDDLRRELERLQARRPTVAILGDK